MEKAIHPHADWPLHHIEHDICDAEPCHHHYHHEPDITHARPPTARERRLLALEKVRLREEPVESPPAPLPVERPHRRQPSRLQRWLSQRARAGWSTAGQDADFLARSERFWDWLARRYFRVSTSGWERLPEGACLLIGVHSGTWLTMDAWMLMTDWWFHFKGRRILHGTAHDVLMAMPGIGELFRKAGVVPAARDTVGACLEAGHSVVIWPGGEVDAMRSWQHRNDVVLGGRKGFVRQAIRSGVPIVPVATVGGAETVFVLSEGRGLARALGLKRLLRSDMAPLVAGLPFGVWLEVMPSHIPLPAKITNEILEPVPVQAGREHDEAYVNAIYQEVERRIQEGVTRLAAQRRWPLLG